MKSSHSPGHISPISLLSDLLRHRDLILGLAVRDVVGRYKGSILGLAWSFFNPLLMLMIYTFVFSVVFKSRWGDGPDGGGRFDFAMILFAGMVVHGLFAEVVNKAPFLIVSSPNLVKKIVFPLQILPVVSLLSALFHATVNIFVLCAARAIATGSLSESVFLFPLVLLPLCFFALGVAWFLSALSVFITDVAQSVSILTTILLFLSPVFYSLSSLPVEYQIAMRANPLTLIIEELRRLLIYGQWPSWGSLVGSLSASLLVAWLGFSFFQKTRKGFADVL